MATATNKTATPAKTDKKTVVTPVFRVSFPFVFEPRAPMEGGGEAKYGLTAVFDPTKFSEKDKERWKAMIALANEASVGKFKKKVNELTDNYKKPMRDGAEKEGLEGFGAGLKFANLTTKFKPGLVDKDKNPIVDQGEIYPGCYMRATVTAYAYDNKGKGVAFGLMNLQKVGDGPRLDSRTDAEEDFKDDDLSPEDVAWLETEGAKSGKAAAAPSDDEDGGF